MTQPIQDAIGIDIEPKKTPTVHQQTTKQQIKAIFLELLQQKPVEQITIREITEPIYLNRSAFYRYFVDVYDLYYQVLDEHMLLFQEQLSTLFQTFLSKGDLEFEDFPLRFFHQYNHMARILMRDPKTLERLKSQQKAFIKQQLHISPDDIHAEYELEYMISGQIGTIAYWMEHNMEFPALELFSVMKAHILITLQTLQATK